MIAASSSSLSVVMPKAASYGPITVTAGNLTGYSPAAFVPIFSTNSVMLASSFYDDYAANSLGIDAPKDAAFSIDFDGDGKNDVATMRYYNSVFQQQLEFLRNKSVGGGVKFAAAVYYAAGAGPGLNICKITAGDLDGDGRPEAVVTNKTSDSLYVYLNQSVTGAISFLPALRFATGTDPSAVAIQDIDGDGRPDIIVSNSANNNISVFRNTGAAGVISFAPKFDVAVGSNPFALSITDLDGDAKPDIAVANLSGNSISVLSNSSSPGSIAFSPKTDFVVGSPYDIKAGDIDGDGKPDIIIADSSSNKISVLRNTSAGSPSFAANLDFTIGTAITEDDLRVSARYVCLSDLDGDGKIEVIASDYTYTTFNHPAGFVSVLANKSTAGNITLDPALKIGAAGMYALNCAELDGDNRPDIFVLGQDDTAPFFKFDLDRVGGPLSQVVCPPSGSLDITSALTGTSYQWQMDNGSGFNNVSNVTPHSNVNGKILHLTNAPSSYNAYKYRCIVDGAYTDVYEVAFQNTWLGSNGDNFTIAAKWSCNKVPDANTRVIVNSGTVIINVNTTIWSLSVGQFGHVTVNPGVTLTVLH